ncbi:TraK family protein [Pseudomonas proteolytica]|uniref:TraK family protein n=1 Tax=Pseudomonas proteolytica TaxID=219574 RepID=UPI001473032E|nr:TraK family protein [Pseudomonas proteolytica]NMZ00581.1 TraK family protein [Pseudomonas proteolytica]
MTDGLKKVYRGAGRVAFLARLNDFRKLIDAGHPLRAIHDDCAEQLGIGYPQFTKYVGRYLRKEKDDGHQRKGSGQFTSQSLSPDPIGVVRGQPEHSSTPPHKPGSKRAGFNHNANSGNIRDDLI